MIGLNFNKFYLHGDEQKGDLIDCYCANRHDHSDITREQLLVISSGSTGVLQVEIRTNNPDLHFKGRIMEIEKVKKLLFGFQQSQNHQQYEKYYKELTEAFKKLKAENDELKRENVNVWKSRNEHKDQNTQLKEKLKELETELEKPWWKTKKY